VSAHITDTAGGLMALAATDPDRLAALAHANTCASCAAALAEAERMLTMLDAFAQPVAPSHAALARVRAELARSINEAPVPHRAWALAPVFAALAAGVVPLWGHLALALSGKVAWALAGAFASAGALAMTLLGPPSAFVVMPLMAAVMAAAWGGPGPVHSPEGFACTGLALACAVPALACAAWLVRQRKLTRPALSLASAAAAGALGGQAALSVVCEADPSHTHNFLFHATAVVIAAAAGYVLAKTSWLQDGGVYTPVPRRELKS
jgi:hypothetical protein